MRKIVSVVLAFLMLFSTVNALAMADTADCACLISAATGEVVFEKNMNAKHAMASTTKIMTAIIALENCKGDDIITVSANAANQEGSAAYVKEGDMISVTDMLYGLMLNSGNDAAMAIAEHIAGSPEAFAELMNKKAKELQLKNTHFVTPSGLDDPEHYSTAYDMAMLSRYAMTNSEFCEIVSTKTAQAMPKNSNEVLYFSNHNKLLSLYDGTNGIKTGFTKSTGRCLVSSAKRNDMEFIAVTLGAKDDWNDHMQMLDYAFSQYHCVEAVKAGARMKAAELEGETHYFVAESDFALPVRNDSKGMIDVEVHMAKNLKAPINAGEKVGYLEIKCDGKSAGTVNVVSKEDIYGKSPIKTKDSFFEVFMRCLRKILL